MTLFFQDLLSSPLLQRSVAAMALAAVTPELMLPVLVSVLPLVSRSSWIMRSR